VYRLWGTEAYTGKVLGHAKIREDTTGCPGSGVSDNPGGGAVGLECPGGCGVANWPREVSHYPHRSARAGTDPIAPPGGCTGISTCLHLVPDRPRTYQEAPLRVVVAHDVHRAPGDPGDFRQPPRLALLVYRASPCLWWCHGDVGLVPGPDLPPVRRRTEKKSRTFSCLRSHAPLIGFGTSHAGSFARRKRSAGRQEWQGP
jgi:hypothetical protein